MSFLNELTKNIMTTATETPAGTYQAFQLSPTSRHALWLRVKANDTIPQTAPSFSYVKNIATDGKGTWIVLMFQNVMIVELYGRHMNELFEHLLSHQVVWIQEFDPALWKEPAQHEPCIMRIKIQPVGRPPMPLAYDPSKLN